MKTGPNARLGSLKLKMSASFPDPRKQKIGM